MLHCVYILHSEKLSRFCTGSSSDFRKRMFFHENPESRKFSYRAKDWKVFLKIACHSRQQALAIEAHIKKMKSSTYIKNLKRYPEMVDKLLQKYETGNEGQSF